MNPVLQGILIALAVQVVGFFLVWLLKKRLDQPEVIVANLGASIDRLEEKLDDRIKHIEDDARENQKDSWRTVDELKELIRGVRTDIKVLQTTVNGKMWKQGG